MSALRIRGDVPVVLDLIACETGNFQYQREGPASVPEEQFGLGSSLVLVKGSTRKRWQESRFKTASLRYSARYFH